MGFDDLVAILMVARAPEIEIAGLSLVAGNAPLETVAANARAARAFFSWTMPIHPGAARPVAGDLVTAAYVLGETGMASAGRILPPAGGPLDAAHALDALVRYLEEAPGEILALGPLTNIAHLAMIRPDLASRIERLVWMGGSAGPGNHTASAEFNAFVDPEAIAAVLGAGVRLQMVGLDACRPVTVSMEDVAAMRAADPGERGATLADLLEAYVRIALPSGGKAQAIFDPVAAAALIAPQTVAFRPARLDVELAGRHTRGMTVVEWRVPRKAPANADIAVSPDAPRIRALILDALRSSLAIS
ncbi:nucleoside hydrolase [Aureimonas populi]|nr:nucleoside hydrolase [Aureimonas populi]